jgi:bacterioferritin
MLTIGRSFVTSPIGPRAARVFKPQKLKSNFIQISSRRAFLIDGFGFDSYFGLKLSRGESRRGILKETTMGKHKTHEKESKMKNRNGKNGHNSHNKELLDSLNRALSLEYTGMIQYLQQHCAIKGQERQQFAPFFAASSNESHLHAQNLGNKIAALGGVPTIEPAKIRQGDNLAEMLKHDLEMEREALKAYIKAWEAAQGEHPLVFWLEEIISQEQLHVDELEKLNAMYS